MGMELRTTANLEDLNTDGAFDSNMRRTLMETPIRRINERGEAEVELMPDTYYLSSSIWTGHHFKDLPQFEDTLTDQWFSELSNRKLRFEFNQESLNVELKYIIHQSIFKDKWSITGLFRYRPTQYRHLQRYVNENWPNVSKISEMQSNVKPRVL